MLLSFSSLLFFVVRIQTCSLVLYAHVYPVGIYISDDNGRSSCVIPFYSLRILLTIPGFYLDFVFIFIAFLFFRLHRRTSPWRPNCTVYINSYVSLVLSSSSSYRIPRLFSLQRTTKDVSDFFFFHKTPYLLFARFILFYFIFLFVCLFFIHFFLFFLFKKTFHLLVSPWILFVGSKLFPSPSSTRLCCAILYIFFLLFYSAKECRYFYTSTPIYPGSRWTFWIGR